MTVQLQAEKRRDWKAWLRQPQMLQAEKRRYVQEQIIIRGLRRKQFFSALLPVISTNQLRVIVSISTNALELRIASLKLVTPSPASVRVRPVLTNQRQQGNRVPPL
eukprot:96863-Karenia_brevis.AAC.1